MELETVNNSVALQELDALQNATHRLKEEVASLKLKEENSRLREENLTLKFELQVVQLKDEIQRLRDENQQLQDDNRRLREEAGQLKSENAKLKAENLRLTGENHAISRAQTARVSVSQDKRTNKKRSAVVHSPASSSARHGRHTRSAQPLWQMDIEQGSNSDVDVGKDDHSGDVIVFARGENDDSAGDDFENAESGEFYDGSDDGGNDTSCDLPAAGLNVTISETVETRDMFGKQESGWGGEGSSVSSQENSVQQKGFGKGRRGVRQGASTRGRKMESETAVATISQPSTSQSQVGLRGRSSARNTARRGTRSRGGRYRGTAAPGGDQRSFTRAKKAQTSVTASEATVKLTHESVSDEEGSLRNSDAEPAETPTILVSPGVPPGLPKLAGVSSGAAGTQVPPRSRRNCICDLCGKTLCNSTSYTRHMQTVHSKEPEVMCPEPGCGKVFQRFELLQMHTANKHCADRPHLCEICGKGFASRHYRNEHTAHCGIKRYKCKVCPAEFASKTTFRDHRRQHEGVHYVCACGKHFKWSAMFAKHKKLCLEFIKPPPDFTMFSVSVGGQT